MARVRPVVASAAAWVVGATAAVSVGLTALSAIGTGLTDEAVQPLSPPILNQPTGGPPISSGSSPSPSSFPQTSADQTLFTRGGTVIVACRPTGAYLVGWSPAPGFRAKDIVRGPGEVAKLKFDGAGDEIEISVRCVGGVLLPKIENEDDRDDGH